MSFVHTFSMHSPELKDTVKRLRSEGLTYSEILKRLNLRLPKSTLSDWCQDVVMPDCYQAKVEEMNKASFSKALRLAHASLRLKREALLSQLRANNQFVFKYLTNTKLLKMLLAILYLGEGAKWKSHSGLSLGSSDPDIVRFYLRLLEICFGLPAYKMKCRVCYRADQDIKELEKYWSEITGIPPENFYKTKPDARTIGKPTRKLDYKGVCVIIGGTTKIQLELELISKMIFEGL